MIKLRSTSVLVKTCLAAIVALMTEKQITTRFADNSTKAIFQMILAIKSKRLRITKI